MAFKALLRVGALVLIACLALAGWAAVLLTYTQMCPDFLGPGLALGVALLTVAGVGAGLLGDRRRGLVGADQSRRRLLALSSGLLLSAWSIALFEHTPYLEPLPGSAGWTAMALLVLAAAGAGVMSAWQGCTLLMVPAAFVGLVDLSRTMFDSGVECEPFHPALLRGLVLVRIAVALGAVAARFSRALRAEALIGAVLLIGVPVAVFAWAGTRHAAPIDREPAAEPRQPHSARFVITHPPLPALPSYRGLKDGDGNEADARGLRSAGAPGARKQRPHEVLLRGRRVVRERHLGSMACIRRASTASKSETRGPRRPRASESVTALTSSRTESLTRTASCPWGSATRSVRRAMV